MTAAESVNEEAAEAMRRTREFVAGAAFGIPEGDDSSDDPRRRDPGGDYLAALLAAALPLLRPSDVPHLERRIRESIAGEAREFAEQWLYDGDNDAPLDGYDVVVDLAARIARGQVSS